MQRNLDNKNDELNFHHKKKEFTFKKRHTAESIVNSEDRAISEISAKMLGWEKYTTQYLRILGLTNLPKSCKEVSKIQWSDVEYTIKGQSKRNSRSWRHTFWRTEVNLRGTSKFVKCRTQFHLGNWRHSTKLAGTDIHSYT